MTAQAGVPRAGAIWPVAVFAAVLLVVMRGITDPDVWTHLTIGREVLHTRGIPSTEFYVAPLAGTAGHFNEWGYGVLLYLAHQWGGIPALSLVNAAIAAATFAILFDIVRMRLGGSPWIALALVMLGVWFADFRLNLRPEMMTYLAVFASLWAVERYRRDARLIALAPILVSGLLLPQFHPSILVCLIVVGAHSLDLLRRRESLRDFVFVAAATVAAGLIAGINPYGYEQVLLPVRFAFDESLTAGITELLPALETEVAGRFLLAAALVVGAFAVTRRQGRIGDLLVAVLFGWLAYRHARNVALFGLLVLPAVASALGMLRHRWVGRYGPPVALAVSAAIGAQLVGQAKWGTGLDATATPVRAGEILAGRELSGPILAFFHLGNYMAWTQYPRAQVIADARHFGFNPALQLHDYLFSAPPGWQGELRARRIAAVVTPMTMSLSGEFVPLALALVSSPNWTLVGVERAGLTFVPALPGAPSGLPAAAAWRQAADELEQNLRDYPDSAATKKNLEMARMALNISR
ncbi:MAG: hypothetical protein KDH15_17715 [Rhodocyclaceae bacterium]|nr:hypothetical protein [Rhodocyclaceae bacterium]